MENRKKNEGAKKEKIKWSIAIILATYLVLFGFGSIKESGNLKEPAAHGSPIIEIPDKYKNIAPGDELVAEIRPIQFNSAIKNDGILDFEIQDMDGKMILKQHEKVAVETQASFLKTFSLPIDMSPGKYTLFSDIKNLDSTNIVTSTASFDISKPINGYNKSNPAPFYSKNIFLILSILLFLILAWYFILSYKKNNLSATSKIGNGKVGYKELIEAIIRNNRFFGGQKSIDLANRIKGLTVSYDGYVLKLEKREIEIMVTLIDLYRISIGQSSIKIARKSIENLLYQNPNLKVPSELMPLEL